MARLIMTQREMEDVARYEWQRMPALNYFVSLGCKFIAVRNEAGNPDFNFIQVFPRYSAEIVWMWSAVTMVRGQGWRVSLYDSSEYWTAYCVTDSDSPVEENVFKRADPDECVAVCLALLDAKGVSIEGLEAVKIVPQRH